MGKVNPLEIIAQNTSEAQRLMPEVEDVDILQIQAFCLSMDKLKKHGIEHDYGEDSEPTNPILFALLDYVASPIGFPKYLKWYDYVISESPPNEGFMRFHNWLIRHKRA